MWQTLEIRFRKIYDEESDSWELKTDMAYTKESLDEDLKNITISHDVFKRLYTRRFEVDQKVRDLSSQAFGSLDHQFYDGLLEELNKILFGEKKQ